MSKLTDGLDEIEALPNDPNPLRSVGATGYNSHMPPNRFKPLTERDKQTLKAMYSNCWQCPIEIGGHHDSPLVMILPKMIKHGLVRRKVKNVGPSGRCSFLYSLTSEGIRVVEEL